MRSLRVSSAALADDTLVSTSTTEASTRNKCCMFKAGSIDLCQVDNAETVERARLVAQGRCDELLLIPTKRAATTANLILASVIRLGLSLSSQPRAPDR